MRGPCSTPLPLLPVRRPPVGDQVHQPDRAELGRPHRDEPPLPAADGRADRARRSPQERSTTPPRRSSRWRSCSWSLPFVKIDDRHEPAPRRRARRAPASRRSSLALVVSVAVRPRRPGAARQGRAAVSGTAFTSLWSVARNRRKRLELFGGNVGVRGPLRAHARRDLPRLRRRPLPRAAHPRQHGAPRSLSSLIPVPGGIGAAEASLTGRPRRDGRRRVHRLRDRPHPPALHLLPAADLGLLLAAVAQPQGIHLILGAGSSTCPGPG